MRQTRPFPDTHPEFSVVRWPGFTEYRVAHYRLARDGSGRVVRGTCDWSWTDAAVVCVLALWVHAWWAEAHGGRCPLPDVPVHVPCRVRAVALGVVLAWAVWARMTQVLHESVLVFPALGIQLETHRGHPRLPPLFVARHFIPRSALEDVVIHEGFRRWSVRYYLAAMQRRGRPLAQALASASDTEYAETVAETDPRAAASLGSVIEVHVAFEHILPYFPVLEAVYLGIQEALFFPDG